MKPNKFSLALALMLFSGAVFAKTVVTVNGTKIDSSEIDRRAKAVQTNSQGQISDSPELRQAITNDLVVLTVIAQEAQRLKLDKTEEYKKAEAEILKQAKAAGAEKSPTFKQEWADVKQRLLREAYIADVLRKNPVNDAQAKQRYDETKARYGNMYEVQLGELVVKTDDAQAALKDLAAKKSFADVVKKYGLDNPTKTSGGILPEYMPLPDLRDNEPEVFAAVSKLEKGQYTKTPIKVDNVNVIFLVNDKRLINIDPFDQVKEGIKETLAAERVDAAVEALGAKAKIEVPKQ